MFLSIVVPCYNCANTIERLLNSIVIQDEEILKDAEVILVDDCDKTSEREALKNKVKSYEDKLNIKWEKTVRDFHCPGNTREIGRKAATGEWLVFIDNDDMFEENAFITIKNFIDKNNCKTLVASNFSAYDYETKEKTRTFVGAETDTWHHGKWYNLPNFLDKYNIHFQDDLFSHEDVYFNNCCLRHLIDEGSDYTYLDSYTYLWVENSNSLSRSYFDEKRYYIETFLPDYLESCINPYLDNIKNVEKEETKQFYFHQVMMGILHGYFYHQAEVWRLGLDYLTANREAIHNLVLKISKAFNVPVEYMIDYIYKQPELYDKIKKQSFIGSCAFVETHSFRDFIMNI